MKLNRVILTCLLAGLLFITQSPHQNELPKASLLTSTNHHTKLDSVLSQIVSQANRDLSNSIDQVQVTLELSTLAVSNDSLVKKVQDIGGEIQTHAGNQIQALIPTNTLNELAAEPSINYIHIPNRPYPDAISEGDAVINAVNFRLDHNTDGAGVKIAILDQGFAGYPDLQASGELTSTVIVRSFRADGFIDGITDHGTACAEIIYDIAPGAEYYFVTYDTYTEFEVAVDYLESIDVDIVSHSLSFFNLGPYDGTHGVSDRINLARDNGIFWVNSAGDYAERHWEGDYIGDDNYYHLWDGISDWIVSLNQVNSGETISANLSWNDWPDSGNNYDLYLACREGENWDICASSTTKQEGYQLPVESFEFTVTSDYDKYDEYGLVIHNVNGEAAPVYFELFTPTHDLDNFKPASSIPNAGDAAGAFTVGAVWYNDYAASGLQPYSSQGPTNSTGGGAPDYDSGSRTKPDIAAPDGVSTETNGQFQGTSASAPHAAGAAALYASSYLETYGVLPNPDQIQMYLEECADRIYDWGTDIDGVKNNEFGAGGLYMCDIPTVIELQRFTASSTTSPWITIILAIFVTSFSVISLSSLGKGIKRTQDQH